MHRKPSKKKKKTANSLAGYIVLLRQLGLLCKVGWRSLNKSRNSLQSSRIKECIYKILNLSIFKDGNKKEIISINTVYFSEHPTNNVNTKEWFIFFQTRTTKYARKITRLTFWKNYILTYYYVIITRTSISMLHFEN